MKKFITIILSLCIALTMNAQVSYYKIRKISVKRMYVIPQPDPDTPLTKIDTVSEGTIYISPNGKYYYWRVSKKGNPYKVYLKQ